MAKKDETFPWVWGRTEEYKTTGWKRIRHEDIDVSEVIGSRGTRIFWDTRYQFHRISYKTFVAWKLGGRD